MSLLVVAVWVGSIQVEPTVNCQFRYLQMLQGVPKLVNPKKKSNPKVEEYKRRLLESVEQSIGFVEDEIQELKRMNADEAAVRPWLDRLKSLKDMRRRLITDE